MKMEVKSPGVQTNTKNPGSDRDLHITSQKKNKKIKNFFLYYFIYKFLFQLNYIYI